MMFKNFMIVNTLLCFCLPCFSTDKGLISNGNKIEKTYTIKEYCIKVKDILKKNLSKKSSRLSKLELELMNQLLDETTSKKECEKKVLEYIRNRYKYSNIAPLTYMPIFTTHKDSIEGVPEALFWLKGSTVGLYEYTKLTGGATLPLLAFGPYNRVDMSSDPELHNELLKYEIFYLINSLNYANINHYITFRRAGFTSKVEFIKSLKERYGENKIVRNLILDYPFMNGSYIWIRDNCFKNLKYKITITPTEELLWEYYQSLIKEKNDKIEYLEKVNKFYGSNRFRFLLSRIVENDEAVNKQTSFQAELLRLSLEFKAWEEANLLLEKFPDIKTSESSMISINAILKKMEGDIKSIQFISEKSK
jgi:hypothetical protein